MWHISGQDCFMVRLDFASVRRTFLNVSAKNALQICNILFHLYLRIPMLQFCVRRHYENTDIGFSYCP